MHWSTPLAILPTGTKRFWSLPEMRVYSRGVWPFCVIVALVLGVISGLLAYVVVSTKRGEQRFRAALAERPHLALRGTRVRTTMGLQVVSRDSEYELTSANAPSVRLRPSLLHSHHDPNAHPEMAELHHFPQENLLDGWIDELRWPSRLEVIRGTPRVAWHRRYIHGRPELPLQPPLADDVHVRGDGPCPETARAAIFAFLEPGTILCLEPAGAWFQVKRGGSQLLDETTVNDLDATFARAQALRAALRPSR